MIVGNEFAWVIEHGASRSDAPLYWAGGTDWTHDNLLAIRFSREGDACRVMWKMHTAGPRNASIMHRVREHGWCTGP